MVENKRVAFGKSSGYDGAYARAGPCDQDCTLHDCKWKKEDREGWFVFLMACSGGQIGSIDANSDRVCPGFPATLQV